MCVGPMAPKIPSMPPMPPPPAAPEVNAAATAARRRALAMQGRSSTILSGSMGDTSTPNIGKTLLGG